MNRPVIIAVAPTGGWGRGENNPVQAQDVATEVIRCAQAGAAVVHLHARDGEGRLTTDLTSFNQAVQTITDSCDIILEASTGGLSGFTAQQRMLPIGNPHAQMGSLNIGSLNFGDEVYKNSLKDVRYWVSEMRKAGVKPSLEVFDTGHMETALFLIQEGWLSPPCNFSFIFGVRWGMPWNAFILSYLKHRVPEGSRWGGDFIASQDFSAHVEAARQGAAMVRVGFEDSAVYNGRTARCNAELVLALRAELVSAGFSIAAPAEARRMLLEDTVG
jgi:3-keto-5-aminohexanoate cleavage enzyme